LLFQTRQQLQAHLEYYQCAELFDSACENGSEALAELHRQLPVAIEGDSTLTRRLDNLGNKIARQLEREDALINAAEIYRHNQQPPARERLVRIKNKQGDNEAAISLCREIIESPVDTDELDFATRQVLLPGKQLTWRCVRTGILGYYIQPGKRRVFSSVPKSTGRFISSGLY